MMMLDTNYFVLIEPNIRNNKKTMGKLMIKCKFKQVIETVIDKNDSRNLKIAMLSRENTTGFQELNLYFTDWRKCDEIKQFFIE